MLIETYTQITISLEQTKLRSLLSDLQESIVDFLTRRRKPDPASIECVEQGLAQFEQTWARRKMERYLIPAVRGTTHEIDGLLAELEALGRSLRDQLQGLRNAMLAVAERGANRGRELQGALENVRHSLQRRLALEEEKLFPLLKRALSAEAWFPIAAQLLAEDGQRRDSKFSV